MLAHQLAVAREPVSTNEQRHQQDGVQRLAQEQHGDQRHPGISTIAAATAIVPR